jgi:hypothetical protein
MNAAAQRYGDIFNSPVIGDRPVVLFISNPQTLQHIFANDTKQFKCHILSAPVRSVVISTAASLRTGIAPTH